MLERVVISRRTSEQELDLLMLLEEDAPKEELGKPLMALNKFSQPTKGEATDRELLLAVSDWLATLKGSVKGHDKFQLAVARNALGMVVRRDEIGNYPKDWKLAQDILQGKRGLKTEGMIAALRHRALGKLSTDVPKYPALAVAREKWL